MVEIQEGIFVSGGKRFATSRSCDMYDLQGRFTKFAWHYIPTMITERERHVSVALNGNIYVMGGRNSTGTIQSAEMYSPANRRWSPLPDLPRRLQHLLAVSHGQCIFVFSGYDKNSSMPSKKTWAYNTMLGQWEGKANMPEAVLGAASTVVNDSVFIVGGTPSSCLSYDLTLDTWTVLTPPSVCHLYPASTMWQVCH